MLLTHRESKYGGIMDLIYKSIGMCIIVFTLLLTAFAQNKPVLEDGVKPHKGIDVVYVEFSGGYATLNAEKVAGLYTVSASYVPPSSETVEGRPAILENFERFFSIIRKRGQTMTISFRVEKRHVSKDLGYDIGVFEIAFCKDGSVINNSKGRYVVVTKKDADGKWRFDVDAYTPIDDDKEDPA